MDVEKAIRTRRTHKAFGAAPVERDVLEELLELATWAPNHHLTNPWRFRVIGARTRERLMELAEAEQPGSAVKLRRAPTLVAVSARQGGDPAEDREDLLAGYWRTVGLLDTPAGREALGIADEETPVGVLYLGHPVQEQRVPERAPLQQVLTYLE
jgi:nitroreductase